MTYTVELVQHCNGQFAGWQSFDGFTDKRTAWEFIKSHGYTAADKDEEWMVHVIRN